MIAPKKTEAHAPDGLIERSRAAVMRAQNAVALAEECSRERQATTVNIKQVQKDSERLFRRVENTLARARKFLSSSPKGRR